MKSKKFVSTLIAAVASFVSLPFLYGYFYQIVNNTRNIDVFDVLTIVLFAACIAVFVVETIAAVKLAKGKDVNNIYNIVRIVLQVVFAVLALIIFIKNTIDYFGFDAGFGYTTAMLLVSYGVPFFAAGATATACGFTLYDIIKK